MPEYLAPGVFVEEIDSGSKPIEGVGTNTAAFVGFAKSGDFNKPIFVTNWTQFCQTFGEEEEALIKALSAEFDSNAESLYEDRKRSGKRTWTEFAQSKVTDFPAFLKKHNIAMDGPYLEGSYLAHAVRGFYDNGGARAYIVRVAREQDYETHNYRLSSNGARGLGPAPQAMIGPFIVKARDAAPKDGGAGDIHIKVDHGDGEAIRLTVTRGDTTESFDKVGTGRNQEELTPATMTRLQSRLIEITLPETATALKPEATTYTIQTPSTTNGSLAKVSKHMLNVTPNDFVGDEAKRTGIGGLAPLEDVNFIAIPDLMAGVFQRDGDSELLELSDEKKTAILTFQKALVDYCELKNDRFAILDPLPGQTPQEMRDTIVGKVMNFGCSHGQAAVYYPWVKVADPARKGKLKYCPPSGHIAGVFARVAVDRGVHKAPANEVLMGANALEYDVSKGEQEILNPEGINCLRAFPGRGIRIWGARTLATTSNASWKYVNVRLLFNFLKRSFDRGLQWVVFEPNDHDLWGRVRRTLNAFLWMQWKEGKLFGAVPEDAYYVKCDEETNPQEMRDQGRLYVEVGVNPVKPAEFVILQIGQWSGGGSINES